MIDSNRKSRRSTISLNDAEVADIFLKHLQKPNGIFLATWLNHYSIQLIHKQNIALNQFQFIGFDGQLLKNLSNMSCQTTSADRVLPLVLKNSKHIALIGGNSYQTAKRFREFQIRFPKVYIQLNANGYFSQLEKMQILNEIFSKKINLIILGLGTPLQESFSLEIRDRYLSEKHNFALLVVTCGGWLNQILIKKYYPAWSYRLKLNWAIRFIREPHRLWRRYTTDALRFFLRRKEMRDFIFRLF